VAPIREAPLAQRGTSPVPRRNLGDGRREPVTNSYLVTTQGASPGCSSQSGNPGKSRQASLRRGVHWDDLGDDWIYGADPDDWPCALHGLSLEIAARASSLALGRSSPSHADICARRCGSSHCGQLNLARQVREARWVEGNEDKRNSALPSYGHYLKASLQKVAIVRKGERAAY